MWLIKNDEDENNVVTSGSAKHEMARKFKRDLKDVIS